MRSKTATTFYLSQRCTEVKLAVVGTVATARSVSLSNGLAYLIYSFIFSLPQAVRMSLGTSWVWRSVAPTSRAVIREWSALSVPHNHTFLYSTYLLLPHDSVCETGLIDRDNIHHALRSKICGCYLDCTCYLGIPKYPWAK